MLNGMSAAVLLIPTFISGLLTIEALLKVYLLKLRELCLLEINYGKNIKIKKNLFITRAVLVPISMVSLC